MSPAIDVLHVVTPRAADLLVASIWQSVLLTGAVALCLRAFPGCRKREICNLDGGACAARVAAGDLGGLAAHRCRAGSGNATGE